LFEVEVEGRRLGRRRRRRKEKAMLFDLFL
jgi:hypothetical protein